MKVTCFHGNMSRATNLRNAAELQMIALRLHSDCTPGLAGLDGLMDGLGIDEPGGPGMDGLKDSDVSTANMVHGNSYHLFTNKTCDATARA